jgi:hypothetical protein
MKEIMTFYSEIKDIAPSLHENLFNDLAVFHDKSVTLIERNFLVKLPKSHGKILKKIYSISEGNVKIFESIDSSLNDYKKNQIKRRMKNKITSEFSEKNDIRN